MRLLVVGLLTGCFNPRPPSGIACDPASPSCPAGQSCLPEGSGFACGGTGLADDGGTDALPTDSPTDPFAHLQLSPGYQVEVFQDFSASFTFDAEDWAEATEFHDNQPDYLFTLDQPYPRALGVIAGRVIFVLDGTGLETHDFGQHPRNTAGQADNLTGAALVPLSVLDVQPTLIVSSASEDAGDGMFKIAADFTISTDLVQNNTRSLLADPTGAFDDLNRPERYLGALAGVIRRSDQTLIVPGDIRSLHVAGADLWITKGVNADTQEQLFRVAATTHTQTALTTRTTLRLSEGPAPDGMIAYAVADTKQLVIVHPDGSLEVIGELVDDGYIWKSAVIPPPGHPLAGKIYLLESHRGLDIDRVLAITPP